MTLQKRLCFIMSLMFCFMIAQASISAQDSMIEGDESNVSLDKVVIEHKFSEININSLKGSYPDGTVVLPPAPWTIKTSTGGYSDGNALAVRASYKNIGGDAPYLKGLWTLDNSFGAPYNLKQIELTDNGFLSGNFAIELKYIPYQTTQFPDKNNNWFGAVANANQGFISIGVAKHKYDGQSNSYGEMYWNFGSENDTNFPIGILANPCDKNTGAQAAYGQYTMKYNYASGSGVSPTIPATTEELPEDFNGYHYARIEFTTDNGITVLTRRGENTPWKKATPTNGLDTIMNQLRIPESNNKIIFRLHKGFLGVDSVKVYKSSVEYPDYIVDSLNIEKKSNYEYTTKVNLTNIGTDIPAQICTRVYETEGSDQNLVDEIIDEYTGTMGQTYNYQKNISIPHDGKNYILKACVIYKNNTMKSIEYGHITLLNDNIASNGKVGLGGAVSILNDSSVIFKNKETQAETEGEYTVDENGVFLIPKTRLDEGVEYAINVRADSDINLKTIDFDGNNVVKVLYDVYAELDNNGNSVNYKLKNRLEQPMEAQFVVIKYNGLKMSSLEFESISLAANEEKQGQKTIVLESGQTAKVFILNNLSDYVLISDAITVE